MSAPHKAPWDAPDWSAGVKRTDDLTPEGLERSALLADKHAEEWRDTAARLRAKAAHLHLTAPTSALDHEEK